MEATIANYMTEQVHSVRPGETLGNAKQVMERLNIRHLPVVEKGKVIGLVSDRDFSLLSLYPEMDLTHTKVEDLMLQAVYSVALETKLKDVVKTMADAKLGSVIVVDAKNQLKGIFTSIDALQLLHKIYEI